MVICLQPGTDALHTVQLMSLLPHHLLLDFSLTLLMPAYPGCPIKETTERVSVCLSCGKMFSFHRKALWFHG